MRGLERIYEIFRQKIAIWIKDHVQGLPDLKDTLLPAQSTDVLEYDEALSEYFDFADAARLIGHFIEDVYMTKRIHSGCPATPPKIT